MLSTMASVVKLCDVVCSNEWHTLALSTPCTVPLTSCQENRLDNNVMSLFGAVFPINSPWVGGFYWPTIIEVALIDVRYLGWRVDNNSPTTVSTAYRWVVTAVQTWGRRPEPDQSYALFPVVVQPSGVLTYSVQQNGPASSRESQEVIVTGDWNIRYWCEILLIPGKG